MESTSLIAILVLVAFLEAGFIFMMFQMGGKLLKAKVKAMLPWYKNKGRFWLHLYKTGTFVLDYVILDKESKIKRKNEHDIMVTGENGHSFVDKTAIEDFVTIHKLDRQPLVLTVEGAPTDILARYRDYEMDISKIGTIEKWLTKVYNENNVDKMREAKKRMINLFYNLRKSFKYLPVARKYCDYAIALYNEDHNYSDKELQALLKKYENIIVSIKRELKARNMRFVNFTEFFNKGNISALFNKKAREYIQIGRESVGNKKSPFDKAIKIGGAIFLGGLALMGYLLIDQGNQLEDMNNKITSLTNKLNKATITVGNDTNTGGDGQAPPSSPVPQQNPTSNLQGTSINLGVPHLLLT